MAMYQIPEYNMAELEKKLAHISEKCAKYGNTFSYTKGEPFFKTFKERNSEYYSTKSYTIKLVPVEVSGTAYIDNWEFIATLEHHHNGNIIKRYNTEIEIPERFKTSPDICEHCHTERKRLNLYVIHNMETDEWKQVGKSCLMSYTNGLSAEYVTLWMSAIEILSENESKDLEFEFSEYSYYEVDYILAAALAVTDKFGYCKAGEELSTKNIVNSLVINGIEKTENYYNITLPPKDDIFSVSTSETVKSIVAYYMAVIGDTEFLHNIQVILSERYCKPENFGLLAYLPFGYKRAMERATREQKEKEENTRYEYFGEVGKRYKDIPVVLSVLTSYDTQYGITFIYKLVDAENHVFTWKTSNCFESGKYIATASVKDHKEYKGQKQTEVTRCKLQLLEATV